MRGLVDVVGCKRGQEDCVYLIRRFGFQFRPRRGPAPHLSQIGHVKLHHALIEGPGQMFFMPCGPSIRTGSYCAVIHRLQVEVNPSEFLLAKTTLRAYSIAAKCH